MGLPKQVAEELRSIVGREAVIDSANDLRIFERADRMPSDDECVRWLGLLIVGGHANEAPSFPGATTRRFEVFDGAS